MLLLRQILAIAITLASGAVGLSACGQQGALYLPARAPNADRASTPPAVQQPAAQNAAGADRPAPSVSKPAALPASATH